jgi:ribosomal protein S18 acetylase RimI-like enzyme
MHYRTADLEDVSSILELYRTVARQQGGIARIENEITEDYISNIITKSLSMGLIIVGVHPENHDEIIAEIHAFKPGIKVFDHVLSDLTIAVHPDFQGKKIGRTIFTIFLEEVGKNMPQIGRVELITRESNTNAIKLYQSLGFKIEGRLEMRIKNASGMYEADIPMGWQNPNFDF